MSKRDRFLIWFVKHEKLFATTANASSWFTAWWIIWYTEDYLQFFLFTVWYISFSLFPRCGLEVYFRQIAVRDGLVPPKS